ncbi:MAG: hypothetical protein LBU99_03225 [Spirochaetaceae bacterium]|jgi:uncharacterized membrane protein|nr:hypothetical protein [Spirochaetaceae bacterium]
MNFWKDHAALRITVMILFTVTGLVLLFVGWGMTGKLYGLGLMVVGLVFLLTTLLVYNKPFETPKNEGRGDLS